MAQPLYAEATCVLHVQSNCPACKMKTFEILGSVCGVYNLDINNEEGLVRIQAIVEPNLFMKALARPAGAHAEPKWVKLRHPKMNRGYYPYPPNYDGGYNYIGNGYNHGAIGYNPYNHGPIFSDPYQYSAMEPNYPYQGFSPYYHGSGLPPPRRHGPFQF